LYNSTELKREKNQQNSIYIAMACAKSLKNVNPFQQLHLHIYILNRFLIDMATLIGKQFSMLMPQV